MTIKQALSLCAAILLLIGCASDPGTQVTANTKASQFNKDREAILAMAGNYQVTFDFRETVALADGYELKDPKTSTGNEVVRVLTDDGDVISLQHVLVAGGPKPFAIKHWRQDWFYEPDRIFEYVGDNTWRAREISEVDSRGSWAQLVYQVDDSPRYAGVGKWQHDHGVSSWTSEPSWRPLPRRDSTTRDDYDVVVAVNRHAIIPAGWVHEQDNSKLALGDTARYLAREIGVNTYRKFDDYPVAVGETYIEVTEPLWQEVRKEWSKLEDRDEGFSLTLRGEPEELYGSILKIAQSMFAGEIDKDEAVQKAKKTINTHTTTSRVIAANDGRSLDASLQMPPTDANKANGVIFIATRLTQDGEKTSVSGRLLDWTGRQGTLGDGKILIDVLDASGKVLASLETEPVLSPRPRRVYRSATFQTQLPISELNGTIVTAAFVSEDRPNAYIVKVELPFD